MGAPWMPHRGVGSPQLGGEGGAGGDKGLSRHLGPLKYLCRAMTGEEQCPAEAPDSGVDGTMAASASAPVAPDTGRGGRASGAPHAPLSTATGLVLLLSLLLLLPSSLQVGPGTGGGRWGPGGSAPAPLPNPPLWVLQEPQGSGGHAARRLPRMTPFWRMVGSRPLGAHCRHSLECVTRACR